MQSSSTNKGVSSSTSGTSGTNVSGTGYTPGIEQRLNEMASGAERVVTNQSISEQEARRPTQERTEYIQQQGTSRPDQYVTQQRVMEQQEAPIRLKQQEVREVQQNTVVQEQPVLLKKQEVQVQKERPIEVTKNTTQHQTLPTIEKKELHIQPVDQAAGTSRTATDTMATGETHRHGSTMDHIKDKLHGAVEKTRDMFHGTSHERTETKST